MCHNKSVQTHNYLCVPNTNAGGISINSSSLLSLILFSYSLFSATQDCCTWNHLVSFLHSSTSTTLLVWKCWVPAQSDAVSQWECKSMWLCCSSNRAFILLVHACAKTSELSAMPVLELKVGTQNHDPLRTHDTPLDRELPASSAHFALLAPQYLVLPIVSWVSGVTSEEWHWWWTRW